MKKINGSTTSSAQEHLLRRKWIIFAAVLALVALASVVVYTVIIMPETRSEKNLVCTPGSTVHAKLVSAIVEPDTKDAKKYTDQIKADPNYKKDINCLNGLVQYNLFVSSSRKAEETLVLLTQIAENDDTAFDEAYVRVGARTIKDVKVQVSEAVKARGEGGAGVLTF